MKTLKLHHPARFNLFLLLEISSRTNNEQSLSLSQIVSQSTVTSEKKKLFNG